MDLEEELIEIIFADFKFDDLLTNNVYISSSHPGPFASQYWSVLSFESHLGSSRGGINLVLGPLNSVKLV